MGVIYFTNETCILVVIIDFILRMGIRPVCRGVESHEPFYGLAFEAVNDLSCASFIVVQFCDLFQCVPVTCSYVWTETNVFSMASFMT